MAACPTPGRTSVNGAAQCFRHSASISLARFMHTIGAVSLCAAQKLAVALTACTHGCDKSGQDLGAPTLAPLTASPSSLWLEQKATSWRRSGRARGDARRRPSNRNPFDLIERDFVAGAVIELGGAWAFVRRHGL